MSIIIVGLGDSDFKNMEVLDGDDLELVDSKGRKAKRDIVQFVKYNDFAMSEDSLAEQVLQEVPP